MLITALQQNDSVTNTCTFFLKCPLCCGLSRDTYCLRAARQGPVVCPSSTWSLSLLTRPPSPFPAPNQGPKALLPSQAPGMPRPLMESRESGTQSLKKKEGTQGITAQRTGRPMSEEPGPCICCMWKALANRMIYGAFQPNRPSTFWITGWSGEGEVGFSHLRQDAAVERNGWDGETDICILLTGWILGESLNYSLGFSFLTCELGKVTGE